MHILIQIMCRLITFQWHPTKQHRFVNSTEKHLRALQSLGESNDQNNILTMIKSKLVRSMLLRLEEKREENEEWTVESF